MIKIAITGNIASGKSCVEDIIMQAGYKVADADKINHEILAHDFKTVEKIKKLFNGYDITDNNGNISREKLGNIVFNNPAKMKQLEDILYKEINKKINLFYEEHKTEPIIFISAAMLFESGFYKDFDKIIFISASEEIRLKRLIKRNNYTKEYAQKRISAQEDENIKTEKSDFIIENNSDLDSLKIQIMKVLNELSTLL